MKSIILLISSRGYRGSKPVDNSQAILILAPVSAPVISAGIDVEFKGSLDHFRNNIQHFLPANS